MEEIVNYYQLKSLLSKAKQSYLNHELYNELKNKGFKITYDEWLQEMDMI